MDITAEQDPTQTPITEALTPEEQAKRGNEQLGEKMRTTIKDRVVGMMRTLIFGKVAKGVLIPLLAYGQAQAGPLVNSIDDIAALLGSASGAAQRNAQSTGELTQAAGFATVVESAQQRRRDEVEATQKAIENKGGVGGPGDGGRTNEDTNTSSNSGSSVV